MRFLTQICFISIQQSDDETREQMEGENGAQTFIAHVPVPSQKEVGWVLETFQVMRTTQKSVVGLYWYFLNTAIVSILWFIYSCCFKLHFLLWNAKGRVSHAAVFHTENVYNDHIWQVKKKADASLPKPFDSNSNVWFITVKIPLCLSF